LREVCANCPPSGGRFPRGLVTGRISGSDFELQPETPVTIPRPLQPQSLFEQAIGQADRQRPQPPRCQPQVAPLPRQCVQPPFHGGPGSCCARDASEPAPFQPTASAPARVPPEHAPKSCSTVRIASPVPYCSQPLAHDKLLYIYSFRR
jgi:hypothetical protein